MYNQPETALEKYEINLTKISKGRGYYLCDTSIGQKILWPYTKTEEKAKQQRELLIYLQNKGIICEQITPTSSGEILSVDNCDAHYILKDYIPQKECDIESVGEICECMKTIARLHKILYEYPATSDFKENEDDLLLRMIKKKNEMKRLNTYIRKKNTKNDFERLYTKYFPEYMSQAEKAINCLENSLKEIDKKQLCHMYLNQHNIVNFSGQWIVINYEKVAISYPQVDIAEFGRKILEKNNWSCSLAEKMINSYESINPLSDIQKEILGALFLFPEKICKIVNQYTSSRKNAISLNKIEKLEKVIEQEAYRELFLQKTFSFDF